MSADNLARFILLSHLDACTCQRSTPRHSSRIGKADEILASSGRLYKPRIPPICYANTRRRWRWRETNPGRPAGKNPDCVKGEAAAGAKCLRRCFRSTRMRAEVNRSRDSPVEGNTW